MPLNTNVAVALVGDRLALDVVLVANLADDLFEQVLDGDQAGGAAVLVDDDGHLRLPPLHLLQQLRHALALGHEMRRAHQRRHRRLRARRQRHEILHEHDADDVVEVVAIDRHARVLLLAEQRAQILQRGIGADGDDVGPRRHHLADEGLGEVDDRLQQLAAFLLGDRAFLRLALAAGVWRGDVGPLAPFAASRSRRGANRLMMIVVIGTSSVATGVKRRQHDVEHAAPDRGAR